ncbi:MAG: iron uptake porin [Elainellaceae cyanobacterium]
MVSQFLWKSLQVTPILLGVTWGTFVNANTAIGAESDQLENISSVNQASILGDRPNLHTDSDISLPIGETAPIEIAQLAPSGYESERFASSTTEQSEMADTSSLAPASTDTASADLLGQINQYAQTDPSMSQVTSISQLSDVQPTDWAFQALQSLVERYGCIAGYPDGTYRGNRAMTRFEFAAGLNACLDRINELIAAGLSDVATRDDLATLQRLQEEFAAELATLRGRVDALEARTAELEANQFSTTTKLTGEAIFNVTDAFGDDDVVDDNQTVFQQRVRLNFNTSFTGDDLLVTRLQVGNAEGFSLPGDTAEGVQAAQVFADTESSFVLDTLEYFFSVGPVDVAIAANAGIFDDFTPTLNPFLEDFDGGSGSISAFGQRNPLYRLGGGQGIGLNYGLFDDTLTLTAGYLAGEGSDPTPGAGLFNGNYSALGQITWQPIERGAIALTYLNSYFGAGGDFGFDNAGDGSGFTGTGIANSIAGLDDDNPIIANSYGVELTYDVADWLTVSAWGGFTDVIIIGEGDGEIWNYALTLAFPDLLGEGNLGGIVAGVQPYLGGLEGIDISVDNENPIHLEAFYKYLINDNISITPGVIWLANPDQSDDNESAFIGTLRTTFTF